MPLCAIERDGRVYKVGAGRDSFKIEADPGETLRLPLGVAIAFAAAILRDHLAMPTTDSLDYGKSPVGYLVARFGPGYSVQDRALFLTMLDAVVRQAQGY
ncbi:hypothetical protein A5679_17405 [Mycobacterium scrofulaceum]|uniref:Uncharacterized protein n=2 Tax=Mycobacterium scrofulaceum TaxID=1783 RepID=A0A1A2VQH6_MYCSC|nr:hypothetical protein A5679_17405 [Mycobacterium scrofulaceum]